MRVYWLQQALADLPADDQWLTVGESARLATLRIPKRRSDWRLGRWTAKRAVLAYLEREFTVPDICRANAGYHDIEVRPSASGAPEVFVSGVPASPTISLSHSNGVAVCAVAASGVSLGCDLELIEPRNAAFIADYFTAEEQTRILQSSPAARDRRITLLWSAKESALKALRAGLRRDTRDLIVTFDATGTEDWRALEVRCATGETFLGWWREHFNYILTVAGAPCPFLPLALQPSLSARAGTR